MGAKTPPRTPSPRRPAVRKGAAPAKQPTRKAPAAAAKKPTRKVSSSAKQPSSAPAGRKRTVAAIAAACALVALLVVVLVPRPDQGGGATASGGDRIGRGISVGRVDVSGMTRDEAVLAIHDAYDGALPSATAVAYASEEALAAAGSDADTPAQGSIAAEQIAADEAASSAQAWATSARDLGARVDAESLADDAFDATRRSEGDAFAGPLVIQPYCVFDEEALESFAASIDAVVGSGRVETTVAVSDGGARAVEGTPGEMVDRGELALQLSFAFLDVYGTNAFAVTVSDAPLLVTMEQAQRTAEQITRALHGGAVFTCAEASWRASAAQLGEWVRVDVERNGAAASLVPSIDEAAMAPVLVANLSPESAAAVSFDVSESGEVSVGVSGTTSYPDAAQAAEGLQEALFGAEGKAYARDGSEEAENPAQVQVEAEGAPESLTFDEALASGLVEAVSSYTTEFSTVPGTENRNHNIALACELLDKSVVKADGGRWSFNETAGNCNADRGFLDAGAIVENEYVAEVGGGICQVATTVFNAVYDAGYPVVSRSNHSLYIASYPLGRDAAVSWPGLDLVWGNDTKSDVLVRAESGVGYLTVTLYSTNPGYTVSTETGDWEEGRKHETRRERDDGLAPGTSYVKTHGSDGSRITVWRTVSDSSGAVLRHDTFVSNYAPITEVIVEGPDAPEDTAQDGPEGQGSDAPDAPSVPQDGQPDQGGGSAVG